MKIPINNTFVWWTLQAIILISFISARKFFFNPAESAKLLPIYAFLAWNIICIIRGGFAAENYWDWKNLVGTAMVLLLPLSIYISTNPQIIQLILNNWIKYALPGLIIMLPLFKPSDALGRYLVPMSFLALFLPLLTKKWKIITCLLVAGVILSNFDARSNVLKYGASLGLGLMFLLFHKLSKRLLEPVRILMMVLPIVLFILALTGQFNVFKMDEYIKGNYTATVVENGEVKENSLTVDTRTFLYEEVLTSAEKNDYIWLGRTPARGNDSESFGSFSLEELKIGRMERFENEVSILNTFTWTGLIGVILYFVIFYRASYLAINRSNNMLLKILGLYVGFRWAYAWVEDFSNFDLSYFFLWIMIGMCFSASFRRMTDLEIKLWIRGVLEKKYRRLYQRRLHEEELPQSAGNI